LAFAKNARLAIADQSPAPSERNHGKLGAQIHFAASSDVADRAAYSIQAGAMRWSSPPRERRGGIAPPA